VRRQAAQGVRRIAVFSAFHVVSRFYHTTSLSDRRLMH
jgi:hypothetical protein